MIRKTAFYFLLGFSQFGFAASDENVRSETSVKEIQGARVITCAIKFPVDSVRFSEDQVVSCMSAANIDSISYVHVIATASADGSGKHNLYLSTRRAGAIEAFLNNRYPDLQVHAFGGGENPKFGKMARIFVVENNSQPQEIDKGVEVAAMGPPEVIEKTITKYVTKIEYKDRPRQGLDFSFSAGPSLTAMSDDVYNFVGVNVSKKMRLPWIKVATVGMRHRLLQSNDVIDINSTSLILGKEWLFYKQYGYQLYHEQFLDVGIMRANGASIELGTSGQFGVTRQSFKGFFYASYSNYLMGFGVGCGLLM